MSNKSIQKIREQRIEMNSQIDKLYNSVKSLSTSREKAIQILERFEDIDSKKKDKLQEELKTRRLVHSLDRNIEDAERALANAVSERFSLNTDFLSVQLLELSIRLQEQTKASKKASKRQRKLTWAIVIIGVSSLLVTISQLFEWI
ncbi:hypothetical protein HZY62_15490 [Maribacter polysiphoniae]|uniref:Uncharacterized protein n=1 Tax=Maribacter polysiphoniae TaxID=429344 RepID=A0A316DYU4_9FLAO|nr:hypothetical protein [Maribacter polysiphoniae]MBD1262005.1 hypothetical protein [Maribacter polysiphoniae]PWK21693.1 hypothetical protein LX92_03472 [Maribacter polysiphoniae]